MAIPKVCGIETEYGIIVRGAESNPVTASSLLINSYLASTQPKVGWDFDDEHPGSDARGFSVDDLLAPDIDTHLVNAVLTNGARYYVDALQHRLRVVTAGHVGQPRVTVRQSCAGQRSVGNALRTRDVRDCDVERPGRWLHGHDVRSRIAGRHCRAWTAGR